MRLGVRVRVRVVTVFPHHGQMGGLLMEGEGRLHLIFVSSQLVVHCMYGTLAALCIALCYLMVTPTNIQ